jgi:tRNA (adenine22-N1)-methyltransferase
LYDNAIDLVEDRLNLILKGRLKLIADKVPECNVVADIGTDHAYLPIYLIQQNICKKAIASDVKTGPVEVANKNISLYKMKDKIETRLGSGLETIESGEADTVIVAGMGGTLITELLETERKKACKVSSLVLQPMNDLDIVRKWLYDHKFCIFDEELVAEGSKIYCVIAAKYDGMNKAYNDFQLHVGEQLINKKDSLLLPYCEMKVRQINRVLGQLEAMEDNENLKSLYLELMSNYTELINDLTLS